MYRVEFSGCLTAFLFFAILLFLLKQFWWLIVGIALILIAIYYFNLIYTTIKVKNSEKEKNYNPEMGEVYKICPYCNTKVRVTAPTCPNCSRALN